jgi:hypothetical protein
MAAINLWLENRMTASSEYDNPLFLSEGKWTLIKDRIRPSFEKAFLGLGSIYGRLFDDCRYHLFTQAQGVFAEKHCDDDFSKTIFRYPPGMFKEKTALPKPPLKPTYTSSRECGDILVQIFEQQVTTNPTLTVKGLLKLMKEDALALFPSYPFTDGEIEALVWSAIQDLQFKVPFLVRHT